MFGEVISLTDDEIKPQELEFQPKSLIKLSPTTAGVVRALLEFTQVGSVAAHIVMGAVIYLWLVDIHGALWFALEENMHVMNSDNRFPALRDLQIRMGGRLKLGHPSLIVGAMKSARFGGELQYDPSDGPDWVVTNRSGRYGLNKGKTDTHLYNVAQAFRELGINVRHALI